MKMFFRKHWRKILIIGIPLLLICAVIVSITKTPPPGFPNNPNLADWLFYILDDWASAGAPVMMLLLAIAAFWAIWENRRMRNEDIDRGHRAGCLREIHEWAKRGIELFSEYQRGIANSSELKALETRLQTLWAEHLGIVRAAEALGDELLADDVKEAANKLEDYFFTIRGRPARSNPTAEECETEFTSLLGIASSRKAKLKL